MLEIVRIHRERQSMYRQDRMAAEQDQILTKLQGDIPMVHDAYEQVLDIYQRTKGHNIFFRSYLGLAEYTAKAVVGTAVPMLYNSFQPQVDRINNYACSSLDSLEEKYPIITRPSGEVIQEGKEKYEEKVAPVIKPLIGPAKLALLPAKVALQVGKTAVTVGTTVASTAIKPAVFAVNVSTAVSSAVVGTGIEATSYVASGVISKGQEFVETGLETPLGQFWLKQFDETFEATEKLLINHYLPAEDANSEGVAREMPTTRTERVQYLAKRIQSALYHRAQGDMVRAQMMASNLLHQVSELTHHFLTLTADGVAMAWNDRQHIMDSIDLMWNKYVHFLPEQIRPSDPVKRLLTMMNFVADKLGVLFTASKHLTEPVLQSFVAWCQMGSERLRDMMTEGGKVREDMVQDLRRVYGYMGELLHNLLNKTVDNLDSLAVDISADLSPSDLRDVAMVYAQGMGVSADNEPAAVNATVNCNR